MARYWVRPGAYSCGEAGDTSTRLEDRRLRPDRIDTWRSSGFRIRGSASYASAVYSGVFCLLAIRHARDWRRGENIQLQELQDHHIFPQAYLKRHGINRRAELNTIANRTLISDETNARIRDKAPADYLTEPSVFPSGPSSELLKPHFMPDAALEPMRDAEEALDPQGVVAIYEQFLRAREAAIISAIRDACGISVETTGPAVSAPEAVDELAADVADEVDEDVSP